MPTDLENRAPESIDRGRRDASNQCILDATATSSNPRAAATTDTSAGSLPACRIENGQLLFGSQTVQDPHFGTITDGKVPEQLGTYDRSPAEWSAFDWIRAGFDGASLASVALGGIGLARAVAPSLIRALPALGARLGLGSEAGLSNPALLGQSRSLLEQVTENGQLRLIGRGLNRSRWDYSGPAELAPSIANDLGANATLVARSPRIGQFNPETWSGRAGTAVSRELFGETVMRYQGARGPHVTTRPGWLDMLLDARRFRSIV